MNKLTEALTNRERHRLLKEIDDFKESLLFATLIQSLDDSILAAAMEFGDSPEMSKDVIDFKRGAIHATRGMKDVFDQLKHLVSNEIALDQAGINDPAKTGSGSRHG